MLTQPVPYFHLKLTLSDSRTIQFSRTCWTPCLPCSTVCWLCIRPLKFYLLQYFMQYVLRVYCYSWVFQVLCFTWQFSFVSIWKRLEGNVSPREWIRGPFWCQTEANDALTDGSQKGNSNTPSSPDLSQYACCVLCLTRRRRNILSVGSGLTALKILFCTGCCSIVVSADLWCKYTKLLFFVLFLFFLII